MYQCISSGVESRLLKHGFGKSYLSLYDKFCKMRSSFLGDVARHVGKDHKDYVEVHGGFGFGERKKLF